MHGPHFLGHATANEPNEADNPPAWLAAYAWDCARANALTERERIRLRGMRQLALAMYQRER